MRRVSSETPATAKPSEYLSRDVDWRINSHSADRDALFNNSIEIQKFDKTSSSEIAPFKSTSHIESHPNIAVTGPNSHYSNQLQRNYSLFYGTNIPSIHFTNPRKPQDGPQNTTKHQLGSESQRRSKIDVLTLLRSHSKADQISSHIPRLVRVITYCKMHDNRSSHLGSVPVSTTNHHPGSHPLLAQVPLTVSPFVSLPTSTTLPYTYKTLPSTLPPSSTGAAGVDEKAQYVVSASGHGAHPDEIIASCKALQTYIQKVQDDADKELKAWQDAIDARELAEKRRVAPGWLDSDARILEPQRKADATTSEMEMGQSNLMDAGVQGNEVTGLWHPPIVAPNREGG